MAQGRRISGHLLARMVGTAARQRPYYLALGRALSGLVLDGRVPTHTRLPAERELAEALGVSRNTVTAAYTWLREHGYLDSRRGAGSWTVLPDNGGGPTLAPDPERVDLGVAAPPAVEGLTEAARLAAGQLAAHVGGRGYAVLGLPELRHAVARRYTERGLPTTPDQIFVTNGAQQGVALLMALLADPGDTLLAESPTYPHSLAAARHLGLRLRTVGVTSAGWDTELLLDAFRHWRPRIAYLIPDFHNPTGALMDDRTRAEVVAEARRTRTAIVVDESAAELALDPDGRPAPTAVHDTDGRVFSVGSASKLLWGGLRVGWIRTSPATAARLSSLRQRVDLATPVMEQLLATHLLADLPRVRAERDGQLRRNRDALAAALREHLPDWRFTAPAGGWVLWARMPSPTATALHGAAERRGVHLAPGPAFGVEGSLEYHVRLSYTQPPEVLRDAVRRVADAYADTSARPGAAPGGFYV
ncbi:PLP-dependent aminotransferase family protein [Thermobifida halotolerans]|uniref:PLP-dependent aminotransferase family protein n=1 Tax=Thermobifida halotolerans TaxID=483545 RepID=A0A399G9Z2_9ACTN|nr:PLP-dependent aminotransferase family protein [Thermobifida halotolerans]UOE20463.1 PLP-dependent aminotransferase family protein [Thermobifida halotolerans]